MRENQMDYSEIEAIIEEWHGPGQVLLTWEDRKGDQCALWLELYDGEFVIESQRYNASREPERTDFDGRYKTFRSLQDAKDALTSFALIASDYCDLHCEVLD